jgi:1,2-diacylglycerol 3-beta-glucosyltransferase
VLYALSLLLVLLGLGYLVLTLLLARKKKPLPQEGREPQRFIFLVPALNEELVIGITIDGLLAACTSEDRVMVIDDGSSDDTAAIVRSRMGDPRVQLFQRTLPEAKIGKGKALNDAYRHIRQSVLADRMDPQDVVLCIVDADGRLEPRVLNEVAPYFRDERVGGVQLLVRIRNRENWLNRFQDYEFLLFASLTQTAREKLGSVGLGGNGQFTRLAALMELGDDPWSECLTEDLDLGVRLAINGWLNRFCGETYVDQQGLTNPRLLIKQRTRWAQGHFQCWKLVPKVLASQLPTVTAFDMCYYLLAPGLVLVAPIMFAVAAVFYVTSVVTQPDLWFSPYGLIYSAFQYVFTFAPALYMALKYRKRAKDLSLLRALAMGHLLALYNYIWYIAEYRAVGRILLRRNGWAKTTRSVEENSVAGEIAGTNPDVRADYDPELEWWRHSAFASVRMPEPVLVAQPAQPSHVASAVAKPKQRPTGYVLRDNYDETPTMIMRRQLPPVPPSTRRGSSAR